MENTSLREENKALLTALLQRDVIKALTFTQPWATLVALGEKMIETRSWRVDYRGPVAIHAAKAVPDDLDDLCQQPYFHQALHAGGYCDDTRAASERFYTGNVLAIALLEDVQRTQYVSPSPKERAFGNFGYNRYAWIFSSVYLLATPQPTRGTLGLWDWHPLEAFWREIQEQHDAVRGGLRG